jgi:hypothetical protein
MKKVKFKANGAEVVSYCKLPRGHDGSHCSGTYEVYWPRAEGEQSINVELTEKLTEFLSWMEQLNDCERSWTEDGKFRSYSYETTMNAQLNEIPRRLIELYDWSKKRLAKEKIK